MNLRRKLEKSVNDYVRSHRGPHLNGLTIADGHDNIEPEIPYMTGYCGHAPPHEDLPPEEGVKKATVVFHLKTQAKDEARAKADNRLEELNALIERPLDPAAPMSQENKMCGAIIAALNADPDTGIYVYDIYPQDDAGGFSGKNWDDQLAFTVVVQEA